MAITFGVTVLPDPPYTRFLELLELAEQQGFEYGWTYDSHYLWHESIPLLTLAADRTSRMKLGHFVTNPGTREFLGKFMQAFAAWIERNGKK